MDGSSAPQPHEPTSTADTVFYVVVKVFCTLVAVFASQMGKLLILRSGGFVSQHRLACLGVGLLCTAVVGTVFYHRHETFCARYGDDPLCNNAPHVNRVVDAVWSTVVYANHLCGWIVSYLSLIHI